MPGFGPDQGPPDRRRHTYQLVLEPEPADQINALRPSGQKAVGRAFNQPAILADGFDHPPQTATRLQERDLWIAAARPFGRQPFHGGQTSETATDDNEMRGGWGVLCHW